MNYKIAMIPLLIAGIFASCNEDEELIKTNPDFVEAGYGALTLTLKYPDTPGTKAVGDTLVGVATPAEKTIKSVAFFVNTETETNVPGIVGDQLGAFGSYFSDELVMSTNGFQEELKEVATGVPGEYIAKIRHQSDGWKNPQVIVIANYLENGLAGKLKGVTSWDELEVLVSEVVIKNPQNPLLMYATGTIESWKRQTGGNGGGLASADFDMQRLVSRIDIRNHAYNKAAPQDGFVLTSAQLIHPKATSYLLPPKASATALAVSSIPFAISGTVVEEGTAPDVIQKLDSLYAYENDNKTAATATAIQINGTYRGGNISKVIEMKRPAATVGQPDIIIPLARNNRYVVNINPAPDSTDITWDIVVKDWAESDTIKVKAKYVKPNLTEAFKTAVFDAGISGITWNGTSKVIDISNSAAGDATLKFSTSGTTASVVKMAYIIDTDASSIGGANPAIVEVGTPIVTYAGSKVETPITINIPQQNADERVPMDIYVIIANGAYLAACDTITITSRPIYNNVAGAQPILMKDGRYWAPINVGATNTTNKANKTANTDITDACGQLFQWGRKYGFANMNNATTANADTTGIGALGRPVQSDLADMSAWDGKLIYQSVSNPSSQGNWLLINGAGVNNPASAGMVKGAWYQQLWNANEGVDNADVVKTNADPCPKGWRVPTIDEWRVIIDLPNKSWDYNNFCLTVPGKESGKKFLLPLSGYRDYRGGYPSRANQGYYWSSSVPPANTSAYYVSNMDSGLSAGAYPRANGYPVRCIQE